MMVSELMTELVAMYPHQLGKPPTVEAWKKQFLKALGEFQGETLDRAWAALNRDWDSASFPRPTVLLKLCQAKRGRGAGGRTGGGNFQEVVMEREAELLQAGRGALRQRYGKVDWLHKAVDALKPIVWDRAQAEIAHEAGRITTEQLDGVPKSITAARVEEARLLYDQQYERFLRHGNRRNSLGSAARRVVAKASPEPGYGPVEPEREVVY